MAMELAALKQDLKMLKTREAEMKIAMADIKAQLHLTQANLAAYEADRAIQRCAISKEQRRNAEIDTGISSLHIGTNPLSSTKQNQQPAIVPATPVGQGAQISQNDRTKPKKATSGFTGWNKVLLREQRGGRFKRIADKALTQRK